MEIYNRLQSLRNLKGQSCFLWGPRQVGKSTLLKMRYPEAKTYNLLDPALYQSFLLHPEVFKQNLVQLHASHPGKMIILDEVQRLPDLLNVVQLMIDDYGMQFVLCGSSARKLKRGGANLLGGRALRFELFPLVSQEIPDFDLLRALNQGLLPKHYLSDDPLQLMQAYVGDYLKEEIAAEGLVRNVQNFGRFLEVAALSCGEVVNFVSIASECGVKSVTAKEYFNILEDTLLGKLVPAFAKRPKRRIINAPRFYFFDVGLTNFLLRRGKIVPGSELFGRAFEHFIYMELVAYNHYAAKNFQLSYWRTSSDFEVDFILGDHEVALEVKGVASVNNQHLKGLKAFAEDYKTKRSIVVSLDEQPRQAGDILILPWREFLLQLWTGKII